MCFLFGLFNFVVLFYYIMYISVWWHVVYRQKFILTNFNFSKRCHRSHTCQHKIHTCQHRSDTCQRSTQGQQRPGVEYAVDVMCHVTHMKSHTQGQQRPGVECAVVWCHVTKVTHVNTEVTHVNTEVKHVNTEVTHVNTALRDNNDRE